MMSDVTRRRNTRPPARHTWVLLGSQYALSAWVGLLYGVPSLISAVLLIQGEGHGQWWQYILFCGFAWLVPVAVLAVFRLFWLPVRPRRSRPVLTLVAFIAAGAVRGLALHFGEPFFGLIAWSDPIRRLVSETLTIGAALAIISVAVSARFTYQDALLTLANDRQELLELQMSAAEEFQAQRVALVEEAQAILNPILTDLSNSLTEARNSAALSKLSLGMREVVDEIVRPLSADLARRSPVVERRGKLVPSSRRRLLSESQPVRVSQFILPFTMTAYMLVMSGSPLIVLLGLSRGVQAIELMVVALVVTLWLARILTWRWSLPVGWATTVIALIHAAVALVFGLLLASAQIAVATEMLVGWAAVLAGSAYLLMRYQLIEWVRTEVIETQEAVNHELDIVLSSLRQQLRVESKRVATILHGPVQTALYAAAIRVASAQKMTPAVASGIVRELETAAQRLESESVTPLDLADFVNEVSGVWGDSVSLTFTQDEKSRAALQNNPTALACVTEVVREGVNNAIKHSGARKVEIDVSCSDPLLIDVTVKNRGALEHRGSPRGFGGDVLTDLTHAWTLTDDGATTTLWAAVALDRIE